MVQTLLGPTGAHARGTNFTRANLGANLTGGDAHHVAERRSELSGADLSGAVFDEANLTSARMLGVNLSFARLHGANLTAIDLGANLTGPDIRPQHNTALNGADFTDTNLMGAHLGGAQMSGVIGANLTGADVSGATLPAKHRLPQPN